jgi:hypothetical protein
VRALNNKTACSPSHTRISPDASLAPALERAAALERVDCDRWRRAAFRHDQRTPDDLSDGGKPMVTET